LLGVESLSLDYSAMTADCSQPDAARVGEALFLAAASRYSRQFPGCMLTEFQQAGAHYLFDFASSTGCPWEDRTVAAWATTPAAIDRRDTSYQRGYPLVAHDAEPAVDRGHLIPHLSGGEFGPNIFRQDRALNRGWSMEGRRYRELERQAARVPGTFFLGHLLYEDDTAHPKWIEVGLLQGTVLQVERFDNRPTGTM
jgi:hypothetical protein